MELVSGCHICGKVASRTCSVCGLPACDGHMDRGVCSACKRGVISEESDEERRVYGDGDIYR